MAVALLRPSLIDLTIAAVQANAALEDEVDMVPTREYLDRAAQRLGALGVPVGIVEMGDPAGRSGGSRSKPATTWW